MFDLDPAPERRPRHWLTDIATGAAAFAGALGLAFAAAPHALPPPTKPAQLQRAVLVSAPAPRPIPVLITFADPMPGGSIVSPFGLRQLPWEGGGRLHAGVDIIGDARAPVLAAADGVVAEAGRDGGYGRFVAMRHAEGLTTIYAHLSRIDVSAGQALKAGDTLGQVGSTGSSTGPHLHFEIRDRDERPMNPTLFLNRQFADARDLPLARAQRFGRRVRIAHVSTIPTFQRARMQDRLAQQAAGDAMSASAGDFAVQAAASARIGGLKDVHRGPDGRPHAQLTY